jgi:CBS-domain-containing membrane protein
MKNDFTYVCARVCTDRGRHAVSVMDPYGRILGFLDQNDNNGKITKSTRLKYRVT